MGEGVSPQEPRGLPVAWGFPEFPENKKLPFEVRSCEVVIICPYKSYTNLQIYIYTYIYVCISIRLESRSYHPRQLDTVVETCVQVVKLLLSNGLARVRSPTTNNKKS